MNAPRGFRGGRRPPAAVMVSMAAALIMLGGCATISRTPFTEAQQLEATIPGIPAARFWADAPDSGRQMLPTYRGAKGERSMLALSGGSDNGAYGAGILNGWTRSGTRPRFAVVTGVSTGALIAPFAFLGAEQDATLERIYTTISSRDIYRGRFPLAIPGSPSAASTRPLEALIAREMTDALIDRIGQENALGRRLFVGTANLDAQRMVVWNMGAIAASTAPVRYRLFRQVLLASSAVPGLFPPVMIHASAHGRSIVEMHVDGGTSAQVLTLPDDAISGDPAGSRPLHIFVIINNKLNGEFHLVQAKTIPIASQSIDLGLRSALSSSVDLSYFYARAHGVDFNLSFIDRTYPGTERKLFDNAYMRTLYAYGLKAAQLPDFWRKRPPRSGPIADWAEPAETPRRPADPTETRVRTALGNRARHLESKTFVASPRTNPHHTRSDCRRL